MAWRAPVLTRQQYVDTVSDLVGFDVRPLVRFEDVGGRRFVPGVSLSSLSIEQRLTTAEAIAAAVTAPARLAALVPCDPAAADDACAARFIEQFALRAYRRPPSAEASAALRALFDAGKAAGGFATGVEWVVAAVLQAPELIYQLAPTPPGAGPGSVADLDPFTLATRLAFFLWNSGPDAELLQSAQRDDLRTPGAIEDRVRRMLADPRAARMREDYYGSWLKLEQLAAIQRDVAQFTPALADALRRSLLQGVRELYAGGGGKVETLFGSSSLFVNDALQKVYGGPAVASPQEVKATEAPAGQRRGVLTHPALLTILAQPDASDPIHRGVFVVEEVLCQKLPDAAPDIPDLPPLKNGLSTRQRLEMHRSNPACSGCHKLFDPVGMAFEGYDAIGRYRTTDQGVPVDSSGEIWQQLDVDGAFANGMELLGKLGTSTAVRDCMVQKSFEYALRRELAEADACALGAVKQRFRSSGDLVDLLASVATSAAFRKVLVEE